MKRRGAGRGRLGIMAGVALAILSGAARAEVYGGGTVLSSEYQYSDVGRGTGNAFFLGYHFDDLPIMVQATRLDLGHPKVNDFTYGPYSFTGTKLGFTGYNYSVGYYGRIPKWGFWLKAGYYSGDSTLEGQVNGSPYHFQESSSGLSWGLGANWMFSTYVGALFDLEGMSEVKTLPEVNSNEGSTVTLYNLGLIVEFPPFPSRPARSTVSSPPPPAPAPVYPPAPAAEPATPPAPAPAATASAPDAAAPAQSGAAPMTPSNNDAAPATTAAEPAGTAAPSTPPPAAGDTRTLRVGTLLRDRPTATSAGRTISVPTPVRLAARIQNPDGAWWNVTYGSTQGWVLEQELP